MGCGRLVHEKAFRADEGRRGFGNGRKRAEVDLAPPAPVGAEAAAFVIEHLVWRVGPGPAAQLQERRLKGISSPLREGGYRTCNGGGERAQQGCAKGAREAMSKWPHPFAFRLLPAVAALPLSPAGDTQSADPADPDIAVDKSAFWP